MPQDGAPSNAGGLPDDTNVSGVSQAAHRGDLVTFDVVLNRM